MKDPIWEYFFKKKETQTSRSLHTLSQSPIFDGLSQSELKKINTIVHERKYQKDEVVFNSGDPGVGMYIICEGHINIYVRNTDTGQKDLVAELGPGQTFGDVALFSDSIRSATVKAASSAILLGLCKPDLMAFLNRNSHLGQKILTQILDVAGRRLEMTNRALSEARRDILSLKNKIRKMEIKQEARNE